MRTGIIKGLLLAIVFLSFSSTYAVNDATGDAYHCFGRWSLGWLDAEFYWRENTTWYKLDTNDFNSTTYGELENRICYLTAQTSGKTTVSQASVPSVCEPSSSGDKNSCLVFQAKQWLDNNNRFYRANLGGTPTSPSYVETWLSGGSGTYSLTQRVYDQMVESTYIPCPYCLPQFITTNHTDFQNQQDTWTPENSSWFIHSKMKVLDVRIRTYIYPFGYSWIWFSTYNRDDSYKKFQVSISKSSGNKSVNPSSGDAEAETPYSEEIGVDDANSNFYDLTALLQKATVKFGDFGDIFKKLFETTNQKDANDQETTSVKAEENEKGEVVAIAVEKVDSDAGKQAKILLEGLTIVAVNGIMLYDLGTIEDQIAYLVTEKIESLTLAEPNMETTTYTAY